MAAFAKTLCQPSFSFSRVPHSHKGSFRSGRFGSLALPLHVTFWSNATYRPAAKFVAQAAQEDSKKCSFAPLRVRPAAGSGVRMGSTHAPSATASSTEGGQTAEKRILVPIANGSEEMEAVIIIDVLRRAGADVTVASVEEGLQITASRNVKLVADQSIVECTGQLFDLVVLPGGMPGAERLRDSAPLKEITQKQAARGALYGAICAAPAVALHSWGLLEGKVATAHPAFSDKLPDTGSLDVGFNEYCPSKPPLRSAAGERVVSDGSVYTSRGPGTAMEYALVLVERLYGKEKAEAVAGPMVLRKGDGTDELRRDFDVEKVSVGERPKVLVPVANGSEEMEAVIIIDVLVRAGAEVHVASVEDSKELVLSRKVKLVADRSITECTDVHYDLIALPGGMPGAQRLHESDPLDQILRKHVAEKRLYAAICAAPAVALETKGLLTGKKATAHPAFVDKLTDKSATDVRVVSDGLLVTSRGPGTAMEFALVLVERLFEKEKSDAVAGPMVMPEEVLAAAVAEI